MFRNTKDSISIEQTSVIYRITYPGCFQKYDGKTHRNLITRSDKYETKVEQLMYQHLSNCNAFNDHIFLFTLPDAATTGLPAKFETEIPGVSRSFQGIFPYIPGFIPYKFLDFPEQESIYPGFSRI